MADDEPARDDCKANVEAGGARDVRRVRKQRRKSESNDAGTEAGKGPYSSISLRRRRVAPARAEAATKLRRPPTTPAATFVRSGGVASCGPRAESEPVAALVAALGAAAAAVAAPTRANAAAWRTRRPGSGPVPSPTANRHAALTDRRGLSGEPGTAVAGGGGGASGLASGAAPRAALRCDGGCGADHRRLRHGETILGGGRLPRRRRSRHARSGGIKAAPRGGSGREALALTRALRAPAHAYQHLRALGDVWVATPLLVIATTTVAAAAAVIIRAGKSPRVSRSRRLDHLRGRLFALRRGVGCCCCCCLDRFGELDSSPAPRLHHHHHHSGAATH